MISNHCAKLYEHQPCRNVGVQFLGANLTNRQTDNMISEDVLLNFSLNNVYLRNEFNFENVHGIMNTSGLLQS